MRRLALAFIVIVAAGAGLPAQKSESVIRAGIIGLDTSHAIEFTRILNDASAADHVSGAKVVAAFKGGSPDLEASTSRIDKYTEQLRTKWNIEIVPDIPALCSKVDA
ncbi:MAG: gfo/Idh/MocA family oxidoreductase, partial [Acidobacteria bacterium]|nr:gfo/Idh/MocA family oxidoreductase [Acidobacteriota bacterium]